MMKGFTLIETIVVVVIIILLTVLIVPYFRDFQRKIEVGLSAEEIESALRESQSQAMAVKDGLKQGVYFDTASNEQYIMFSGSAYNPLDPENRSYKISEGVEIENVNLDGGNDYVVFEKLTGATTNNGTVKIRSKKDNSLSATIIITNNGKITIQ